MKVLITGSEGFIAKNLRVHLEQKDNIEIICFNRHDSVENLPKLITDVSFVFHLAGANRPKEPQEFTVGNEALTQSLCEAVKKSKRKIPIVFSSSIQADNDSLYGKSKYAAEKVLNNLADNYSVPVCILRLPNVFGKWCKPNYNSVVATFCHNISRNSPIEIHDPEYELSLLYIDDLVAKLLTLMTKTVFEESDQLLPPVYSITIGALAKKLMEYQSARETNKIPAVGTGFERALYATFLSYIKPTSFSYLLKENKDDRGSFIEVLKTDNHGQYSFFTAHPGVTRGGHFHHTKNEKFLVVKGKALFRFENIVTGEYYQQTTSDDVPEVVETVPGWSHDITNIGEQEMIVMLWANEIFDPQFPDTYSKVISHE